jgi:hypothetical protein
MDSTVHIGIFMGSKFRHAINENLRFLNACPIIQINHRSSSDIDIQTGKPGTPFIHVKRWKRWRVRRYGACRFTMGRGAQEEPSLASANKNLPIQ